MTSVDIANAEFEITLRSTRLVRPELPDDGGYARWTATLGAYETNPDASVDVATALVVLFRDARWNTDFYNRMDEQDSDMEIIASAIAGRDGAASEKLFDLMGVDGGDVIVIDRVGVPEEYRGARLSHMLVDAIAQALSPEGVVVLLPMPAGAHHRRPARCPRPRASRRGGSEPSAGRSCRDHRGSQPRLPASGLREWTALGRPRGESWRTDPWPQGSGQRMSTAWSSALSRTQSEAHG
jgi:hypothetical protein